MFKLNTSNSIKAPVTVEIPVDGGRKEKANFELEFKRPSREEFAHTIARLQWGGKPAEEIDAAVEKGELKRDVAEAVKADGALDDLSFLHDVTVGWNGVADEGGEPLPFTPGNYDRLLNVWPVMSFVVKSYFAAVSGERAKN